MSDLFLTSPVNSSLQPEGSNWSSWLSLFCWRVETLSKNPSSDLIRTSGSKSWQIGSLLIRVSGLENFTSVSGWQVFSMIEMLTGSWRDWSRFNAEIVFRFGRMPLHISGSSLTSEAALSVCSSVSVSVQKLPQTLQWQFLSEFVTNKQCLLRCCTLSSSQCSV